MATKRKTLPKNFEELLNKRSLQELKDIFNKCHVDAYGGLGKQSALAYNNCPHELAKWLVEHGAHLQSTDIWGNTPLHSRARSIFGNIKSLLELGADVNYKNDSIGTPLHAAAHSHNIENTVLLIDYGAQINVLNSTGYTPLELTLKTCRNIDIVKTVKLCIIYLNAGVQMTTRMKKFVIEIGKQFEFYKPNFNNDSVAELSDALRELYKIFDVEPVEKRNLYNGKSLINVHANNWQTQHQELWDLLVPPNGMAETIQGEVIRITGRIANEIECNAGINWDNDYRKMASNFLVFVKQGKPLTDFELLEAGEIIKTISQTLEDVSRLCELGVKWVIDNPSPLKLSFVGYKR